MLVKEEPHLPLTLVGFEQGAITGACRHELGDVQELETTDSEGQVGVVALDDQIDARGLDQVRNQDIFQHVQIVFARVETHHDQFGEVAMQVDKQSFLFFSKRLIAWAGAAGKATGRLSGNSTVKREIVFLFYALLACSQRPFDIPF